MVKDHTGWADAREGRKTGELTSHVRRREQKAPVSNDGTSQKLLNGEGPGERGVLKKRDNPTRRRREGKKVKELWGGPERECTGKRMRRSLISLQTKREVDVLKRLIGKVAHDGGEKLSNT